MSYIIYLTSRCNLDCEYCYERENRNKLHKQIESTEEDVRNFIEKVKKDGGGTIVLFGGEPLLRWDLIKYAVNYVKEKKYTNIYFNVESNATLLQDDKFFEEVKNFANKNKGLITFEFSFDASGNYRRVDKQGNDITPVLVKILDKINKYFNYFHIRYTIHKGNYKNVLRDWIYIIYRFNNVKRIVVSINQQEIDYDFEEFKNYLTILGKKIYQKFNIPICDYSCELCDKCIKGHKNIYYVNKKLLEIEEGTQKEFDHFIKGESNE